MQNFIHDLENKDLKDYVEMINKFEDKDIYKIPYIPRTEINKK